MTALTINTVVDAGTAATFVAAAAGQTIDIGNGHNTFLYVKNANASSVTVTITAPGNTAYGQPNPDPAIVVATGTEAMIPIRKDYDPGDGTNAAAITYSITASVTVAAIRVA